MTFETQHTSGAHKIEFSPTDFLADALNDFLESGAKTSRIASAIIKIATGVELLLKDRLERICPALVLEKLDDAGMQVAKIFNLGKQMRSPKDLDTVELRTAAFPVLLNRATKFFDIADVSPHLYRLYKIRNSLIHHRGTVDVLEVNLLLVQHIFPLVERLSREDKEREFLISKETWAKIDKLRNLSVDALSSQLAKKIAHHSGIFSRTSAEKRVVLAASRPEREASGEDLTESNLICPGCKSETLAAFQDYDVDTEDGEVVAAYNIPSMRCRVCGLRIDEDEIRYIIANFKEYVGENEEEKKFWEQSIDVEDLSNYHDDL
jgi:hypothetical protein